MFFRFPPDARWNPDRNTVEFGIGARFPARLPNPATGSPHARTLPRNLSPSPDKARTHRGAEGSPHAVDRRRQCRNHRSRFAGTGNPGATSTPHWLSPGLPMRAQQAVRDAEHRFPVRVRIAVPPEGFGSRLDQIIAWLDANCGADGWTSTPSSTRGVVNDALAVYFLDATIASAFVAGWCAAQRIEIVDGVYRVRDDEPTSRVGAGLHKTP
jgi:hypothetical protein